MMSDTLRLHLAIRGADRDGVSAILDRHPELVDARENWDVTWLCAGVAPVSQAGTPLGRAIALGHRDIVELLLARGADIDGGCGCATGESPIWTAIAAGRPELASLLLSRGADPKLASKLGTTPLHIAAMRGDERSVDLLLAAGAPPQVVDSGHRTPIDWARERGHHAIVAKLAGLRSGAASAAPGYVPAGGGHEILESGIKAFDLFCPLGRGRVLRQQARVGYGHLTLLAELTHRWMARPNTLVAWCGFEPRPYSRNDFDAELREFGLGGRVALPLMAPEDAADQCAERLFALVSALREQAASQAIDVALIVIEELGHEAAVRALFPLFGRAGEGSVSAIVSGPVRQDPAGPQLALDPAYSGQVVFDLERGRRNQWPALSGDSRSVDETPLADEARRVLAAGGEPARELHQWMCQHFYAQELTWAVPGQWVPWTRAAEELRGLLGKLSGPAPA